ncbi:MAG: 6-carboxytetrahydropterin synthase [Candidatus Hadarchaeales archaeon]
MRIEVSGIRFSAAHLIAGHGKCERLHGHNWSVSVSVEGEVDEGGMVLDFLELRKVLEEECSKLDHRVLLPERSQHLRMGRVAGGFRVEAAGKEYLFPEGDILLLPLREVTAEELARLLGERVLERIGSPNLKRVEVRVEESPGQFAVFSRTL